MTAVDALSALVRGASFLGLFLLIGAGVFRFVLAPAKRPDAANRAARRWVWAGAGLVAVCGFLDLYLTLRAVVGPVGGSLLVDYAGASRHGRATVLRAGSALGVAAWTSAALAPTGLGRGQRRVRSGAGTLLWALGSLAVLAGFSTVAHAAAAPGWAPVPADLLHLIAATVWGGAVVATAFLPIWTHGDPNIVLAAMGRVSRLGLAAVILLFATGVYSASLHLHSPEALTGSRYGGALVAKVSLVLATLALAALQRWRFLPRLKRFGATRPLRLALRVEALLLLGVLALTAVLTTSPLPH